MKVPDWTSKGERYDARLGGTAAAHRSIGVLFPDNFESVGIVTLHAQVRQHHVVIDFDGVIGSLEDAAADAHSLAIEHRMPRHLVRFALREVSGWIREDLAHGEPDTVESVSMRENNLLETPPHHIDPLGAYELDSVIHDDSSTFAALYSCT